MKPSRSRLTERKILVPKLIDRKRGTAHSPARLLEVTRTRHARYGDTLFHLEPNVKDCPGGLRDAHICAWLDPPRRAPPPRAPPPEFQPSPSRSSSLPSASSSTFATAATTTPSTGVSAGRGRRCLRSASTQSALPPRPRTPPTGCASTSATRAPSNAAPRRPSTLATQHLRSPIARLTAPSPALRRPRSGPRQPRLLELRNHPISSGTRARLADPDPAHDPEIALNASSPPMARTGAHAFGTARLTIAASNTPCPLLSAHARRGPRPLATALAPSSPAPSPARRSPRHARPRHPRAHPARVPRHRRPRHPRRLPPLHRRRTHLRPHRHPPRPQHSLSPPSRLRPWSPWAARFASILRGVSPAPLAALSSPLSCTTPAKATPRPGHAAESERMAINVLNRLELDPYEAALVLDLIAQPPRDVRRPAPRCLRRTRPSAPSPHASPPPKPCRMLTLFTYADIAAVHPDALTPWKAENLWQLHIATANFLDRNVDDERVAARPPQSELGEIDQSHPRPRSPHPPSPSVDRLPAKAFPSATCRPAPPDADHRTHSEHGRAPRSSRRRRKPISSTSATPPGSARSPSSPATGSQPLRRSSPEPSPPGA